MTEWQDERANDRALADSAYNRANRAAAAGWAAETHRHSAIRVAVLTEPTIHGEPVWAWKCRLCGEAMYEVPADYAECLEDCAYEDEVMKP